MIRARHIALLGFAIAVSWPLRVQADSVSAPSAIVAGAYVAPDGTIEKDVAIILAEGKIKDVVPAGDFKQTKNVVHRPDAVVSPGFIDIRSVLGAYGKARETAFAIDPGASARSSLDFHHPDFRRAVEAGVTTAVVAPSPDNLVSGEAVIVKTSGMNGPVVLQDDGPLVLALGPSVWEYDRKPTSRIGSLAMLRHALSQAKEGKGHERIQAFVKGELRGLVFCGEAMDVSSALRTLDDYTAKFTIVHNCDEWSLADELSEGESGIVVGPYDFSMSQRTLSCAGKLAAAEVPVAFAAQMPAYSTDSMRITAALAVRHGMDAAKARQAMTSIPAAMIGVNDRVGSIAPGLDADLIVFSGDPLRLDSQVREVYIDGVRVFGRNEHFLAKGDHHEVR